MHKHSPLLFPALILIGIVLGGSLYIFGGSLFEPTTSSSTRAAGFAVLAEGTDALGVSQRAHFRIKSADEYETLWQFMFSGEGPPLPVVDFSEEEVLAVLNGSHSTTGFSVRVVSIEHRSGVRSIVIERTEPGAACAVASQITSPYIVVRVPASTLPIERIEQTIVNPCL